MPKAGTAWTGPPAGTGDLVEHDPAVVASDQPSWSTMPAGTVTRPVPKLSWTQHAGRLHVPHADGSLAYPCRHGVVDVVRPQGWPADSARALGEGHELPPVRRAGCQLTGPRATTVCARRSWRRRPGRTVLPVPITPGLQPTTQRAADHRCVATRAAAAPAGLDPCRRGCSIVDGRPVAALAFFESVRVSR